MILTVATKPYRRPEARHLGPAQEDDGLPAAELCRELRPVDLRFARRLRRQDAGDRRRRPLLQSRGDPEGDPHRARQRLRPHRRRPRRPAVDARRLGADPQPRRLRRHHPLRLATIPAAPTAISASNTTPSNGGPAPEKITDAIFARTKTIAVIKTLDTPDVDLDALGDDRRSTAATVEIVDPVTNYAALMRTLFDFDAIRALFASGFRMRFDAMHAITGPYAHAILEGELGAPARHGGQRHAAARFRRPPSRPQPHLRQGALRRDDVAAARPTSAPPPTATATAT